MSVYFLPALIGLALKLIILAYAYRGKLVSASFKSLLLIFACHNAIELIAYIRFVDGQSVDTLYRVYYVATIAVLMLVGLHAATVSGFGRRGVKVALVSLGFFLSLAVLLTDAVVSGVYSIGYSGSAIKGDYYFLFAMYLFATIGGALTLLVLGYRNADSQIGAMRSLYSIAALLPLMLVFVFAIVCKLMGVGVNAAGIIPIATTLFLFISLKSESKHRLTDLRRFLPYSPEQRSSAKFLELMDAYCQSDDHENAYGDLRSGLERQVILYTLEKCENNITQASQMMGLQNRSTLYSMMKRLEIDLPGQGQSLRS